jgi:hypothetical protein
MVGTVPDNNQVPINEPTANKISTAPRDIDMPWIIAFSIACQVWPFLSPITAATPVANNKAIWLGPEDELSPKKVTPAMSKQISTKIGIKESNIDGGRVD